jgi:hypothetical protein
MPSSEVRVKRLEAVIKEREKNKAWPESWSNAARAILRRIDLAELDQIKRLVREDREYMKEAVANGVPRWDVLEDPLPDWRKTTRLEDLAKHIPASWPKVRQFILADSIDDRKLQMATEIREWFRLGPNPQTGAAPGIDEADLFASIEKLMDLQSIEWNTPLPLVRIPRGNTRT